MIHENLTSGRRYYIKPDKFAGKLSIYQKNDDNKLVSAIEGYFVSVTEDEYKSEKFGLKKYIIIQLQDGEDSYFVQLGKYTFYTLSVLNKLATLTEANKIIVGAFADNSTNLNVWVKHNGQKLENKISNEDLKKKRVYGADKSADALAKAVDHLLAICKDIKPLHSTAFEALSAEVDVDVDVDSDDLPF